LDQQSSRAILTYVRPGPTADGWLRQTIAELKGSDPLRPLTIVVPNYYAGTHARWNLARHGGLVNVRTLRLAEVAGLLARPALAELKPLSPVVESSAVRAVVAADGQTFGSARYHHSLHRALISLFRELRRVEGGPSSDPGNVHPVAQAALSSYGRWRRLTEGFVDQTETREVAARRLQAASACPPELAELGDLVLLLPTRVDPVDARLIGAIGRWVRVRVAIPWLADPLGLADEIASTDATRLAQALGVAPPQTTEPPAQLELHAETRVIRATDPAEEVREVVRQIIADVEAPRARDRVPLHRTAILYRQTEPYGTLVRETLTLAEVPWSALEGRSLVESRPGRALLTLIRLPEYRFSREAVLSWVDLAGQHGQLSAAVWDRLSRAANVVRGGNEWITRLRWLLWSRQDDARQYDAEGQEARAESCRHDAQQAAAMIEMMEELTHALRPPADGSPWSSFVDWAETLRQRFGEPAEGWTEHELAWAEELPRALESLREADRLETTGPTLGLFLDALQDLFQESSLPVGRLGVGVMVGPVQSVTGLAFDRVYLVGLTEGSFPPTPSADPFEDPVHRAERQRSTDRQSFLTALAAADGGRVTLSAPDAASGREAFPSRWLLEVAAARMGQPTLHTAAFKKLREEPWLRVLHSSRDAVARAATPSDLHDRRLEQVVAWTGADRPLEAHPLASRAELPLGRALIAVQARLSDDFSVFDGNLAELVGRSTRMARRFDGHGAISASAVETWASCPFRYFLGYVLQVERTTHPEESWTIDPLERGNLVHRILEEFFKTLHAQGRPRAGERYSAGDVGLIEVIAERHFAHVEELGKTGHPLIWQNARHAILADLRTFLAEDEAWRRSEGMTPAYFEQAFGTGEPGAWPAVEVDLGDRKLRFRGLIDRVDLDARGERAYVFDYKTGGASSYRTLKADPVLAGQHVQLAIYTRAVRGGNGQPLPSGGAYWFVSRKGEFTRTSVPDDAAAVAQRLTETLRTVADGVGVGAFLQAPGDDGDQFSKCSYCDFERVCPTGRDELWARKLASPAHRRYLSLQLPLSTPPSTGSGQALPVMAMGSQTGSEERE
jgi:ATP-dependent helicase/nuclease subunit B